MLNVNRVVLTGNLTHDPELKALPSGQSVCHLRMAVNTRRKIDGEWVDRPNYFNVTTWAGQAENCAKYLSRGKAVAIDGRLQWREWETQDGQKRQTVDIIAENIQFLTPPPTNQDPAAPLNTITPITTTTTPTTPAITQSSIPAHTTQTNTPPMTTQAPSTTQPTTPPPAATTPIEHTQTHPANEDNNDDIPF